MARGDAAFALVPEVAPAGEDHRPAGLGDGWSDRCASLAADRVFARTGLADYLHDQGVPYEPYETFFDVAAAMVSDTR